MLRGFGGAGRRGAGASGAPGRFIARIARRDPLAATAVVIVAAAALLLLVTDGGRHRAVGPRPPSPSQALPGDQLGPSTGEPVSTYVAVAKQRLATARATGGTGQVTAVVDLTGYLTPAAVTSALAGLDGVQVIRGFARVPPPASGEIHTVSLSASVDLATGLAEVRSQAAKIVSAYRKRVAIAHADPTAANEEVVTAYADDAQQAKLDANGIGPDSGCVFALVVTGPISQLEQLSTTTDVRVLDPAPQSVSSASLMIVPLEPQVTATVGPLAFAGE
jgi:hypothetical protein